jgi:hypothetical protein
MNPLFLPMRTNSALNNSSPRLTAFFTAAAALFVLFFLIVPEAHAQRTWLNPANKVFDYQATGGAWSPNWWSPENSTTLIFDGGNNDYTGNITNNSTDWNNYGIRFQNDMLSVTITGNSFDLSISSGTAKIENATTNTQTIAVTNVSMDNGVRELNPIDGDLVFNVQNIFMGNAGTGGINVWGDNGKTLWLNGVVSEQHGGFPKDQHLHGPDLHPRRPANHLQWRSRRHRQHQLGWKQCRGQRSCQCFLLGVGLGYRRHHQHQPDQH